MKSKSRIRVNKIFDAVMAVDCIYQEYAKKHHVNYIDMLLFYELLEDDEPYTQKRMCDELDISKTTLNSVIKRMMKAGYIELNVNKDNTREKFIVLTDAGNQYAHDLIDPLFKMEEKAISLISDAQIQQIENTVATYADSLSKQIEEVL